MISMVVDATWISCAPEVYSPLLQADPTQTFAETLVAVDLKDAGGPSPSSISTRNQTPLSPTLLFDPKAVTQTNRSTEDLSSSVPTIPLQLDDANATEKQACDLLSDLLRNTDKPVEQKSLQLVAFTTRPPQPKTELSQPTPENRKREAGNNLCLPELQAVHKEPTVEQPCVPSARTHVVPEPGPVEVNKILPPTNTISPSELATDDLKREIKIITNKDSLLSKVIAGAPKRDIRKHINQLVDEAAIKPEVSGLKQEPIVPSEGSTFAAAVLVPIDSDSARAVISKPSPHAKAQRKEAELNISTRPRESSQMSSEASIGASEATSTSTIKTAEATPLKSTITDAARPEPDKPSLAIEKSSLEVSIRTALGTSHENVIRSQDVASLDTSSGKAVGAAGSDIHAASNTEIRLPEWKAESGLESSRRADVGHGILSATHTSLEVGVPNGVHGWLKVRAEMQDGLVTASITTASATGREMMHRELPMLSNFLESEKVDVASIEVKETLLNTTMFQRGGDDRQHQGGPAERNPPRDDANADPRRFDGTPGSYGQSDRAELPYEFLSNLHFMPSMTAANGSWLNVRV